METASTAAATRGGSLQNPSPNQSRKEWCALSNSHNVSDATDNVNRWEADGFSNGELLEQQLLTVSRKKGELQQLENELRDQMIARQIHSNFESQFTEYADRMQEHIQEKERQYAELQEQNRIAQETIMYKDEQLREAQGWIARAQEMDALHSSTNHSLQAELQECTQKYNQLWQNCQRQFAEMERLHVHTLQQLQHELANVKEGGRSQIIRRGRQSSDYMAPQQRNL